jgi:PleD family two-component response regulator
MKNAVTVLSGSTSRLNGSIVHCMSAGKILVVDDDPQIRRVLKIMLTGQGYEIVERTSILYASSSIN